MTAYDSIIARLLALHPKRIDLSLDRVRRLLDALDHPERRLPPVIHVAGTNGKGSTIAFMRAMLEAAGRSVHVYTSPHLVRFNERFRLAGTLVSDEALAAALEECERANGGEPITVFEIETAAGFLLFSRNPADVLLLEVGLGGRLDATNVIDKPLASVITPVSMDHLEFLGDTLEKIAAEKAAILKRGVPAVIAPQPDAAMAVIERQAAKAARAAARRRRALERARGARPPGLSGRGRSARSAGAEAQRAPPVRQRRRRHRGAARVRPQAAGRRVSRPASSRRTGRRGCSFCRSGALKALAPPDSELWLDGGHNAEGGRAVAAAIGGLEERVSRPLVLIVGMLATKDCEGYLRNFAGLARRVFAIPIPTRRRACPRRRSRRRRATPAFQRSAMPRSRKRSPPRRGSSSIRRRAS